VISAPSQDLEETVKRFVRHFSGEIQVIASAELGYYQSKYRSLLLCCLIDTMSNIIEIAADGIKTGVDQDIDKKKFLLAVERFGNWPDCTRICRPHLEELLKRATGSDFRPVRDFVATMPPWPDQSESSVVSVGMIDPHYSDLASVWPKAANDNQAMLKSVPYEGRKVHLNSLQHHALLYEYRNKLVHETRATISESEDSLGHTQPYYCRVRDWNGKFWQLYQPPGFLARMAEDVLGGLRQYCLEQRIEPFSRLFPGRYWFERPC